MGWLGAIQKAAASSGDTLSEQQLGDSDIPVIVYRCVDYITQCGELRLRDTGPAPPRPSQRDLHLLPKAEALLPGISLKTSRPAPWPMPVTPHVWPRPQLSPTLLQA